MSFVAVMYGILAVFGAVTAVVAERKGYNPVLWFFSGGIVGLIIIAILPQVNDTRMLPEEEHLSSKLAGNITGGVISAIEVIVVAIVLLKRVVG